MSLPLILQMRKMIKNNNLTGHSQVHTYNQKNIEASVVVLSFVCVH